MRKTTLNLMSTLAALAGVAVPFMGDSSLIPARRTKIQGERATQAWLDEVEEHNAKIEAIRQERLAKRAERRMS